MFGQDVVSQVFLFSLPVGFEWVVIVVIALLIFGKKLPSIAKGAGKTIRDFKKEVGNAFDSDYKYEDEEEEKEVKNKKTTKKSTSKKKKTAGRNK